MTECNCRVSGYIISSLNMYRLTDDLSVHSMSLSVDFFYRFVSFLRLHWHISSKHRPNVWTTQGGSNFLLSRNSPNKISLLTITRHRGAQIVSSRMAVQRFLVLGCPFRVPLLDKVFRQAFFCPRVVANGLTFDGSLRRKGIKCFLSIPFLTPGFFVVILVLISQNSPAYR